MTLDQLRIFIAVADRQHMTEAAKQLNLTQSAASAEIATLEARYNIKLFDRIGRGIVLTRAGHAFLKEARAVVGRAHAAEQVLDDLAGLRTGQLTISASQTVANYWLPPRLQAFQRKYPGIKVHVRITNTELAARDVHDGLADLAVVEGQLDDPVLSTRKSGGDELVIVVAPDHSFVKLKKLTAESLRQTPWIVREQGSGTRTMFASALRKYGLNLSDLTIELELASNEAICTAVRTGHCASALSELVVAESLAAGSLVKARVELTSRSFYILRHKDRYLSSAEAEFTTFLP